MSNKDDGGGVQEASNNGIGGVQEVSKNRQLAIQEVPTIGSSRCPTMAEQRAGISERSDVAR